MLARQQLGYQKDNNAAEHSAASDIFYTQFKNVKIKKGMYMAIRTLCSDSVRMAIHTVNFDIFKWLYLAYY